MALLAYFRVQFQRAAGARKDGAAQSGLGLDSLGLLSGGEHPGF